MRKVVFTWRCADAGPGCCRRCVAVCVAAATKSGRRAGIVPARAAQAATTLFLAQFRAQTTIRDLRRRSKVAYSAGHR